MTIYQSRSLVTPPKLPSLQKNIRSEGTRQTNITLLTNGKATVGLQAPGKCPQKTNFAYNLVLYIRKKKEKKKEKKWCVQKEKNPEKKLLNLM